MEAPLGAAPSLTCVPRTSCRSVVVVQVVHAAMAYLFVSWSLSSGHAPHVVGAMVAGVLLLTSVVTRPMSNLRAVLQRVLETR